MNKLLIDLREGKNSSFKNQILLIIQLAFPSILAQLSTVIMEYIDASMVGQLGANDSASIGLVSSTTWLLGGITSALGIGFTVQIAQFIGAGKFKESRQVMKQGIAIVFVFSLLLALIGYIASFWIPSWLGGSEEILESASIYLKIYSLFIPICGLRYMAGAAIQSSGNMKIPSMLNMCMCILDVVFNYIFIFPSRIILGIPIPGLNLRVMGAALGTGCSEVVCTVLMMMFLLNKCDILSLHENEPFQWNRQHLVNAQKIGIPVAIESTISCGAYVAFTKIVAPLGTIAIAANSFSITAEGICYMPGYGIGVAATTIIGQSIGAKRNDLTKTLGYVTTVFGTIVMAGMGLIMYVFAPFMIGLLTPNLEIQALAIQVLRIEAFAEPLYGASIICSGVFRGAGDTLISTILNFVSMWCVRIPLAFFLAKEYGLSGVWFAMAFELCFRGCIFLVRLIRNKWVKNYTE